MTDNERFMNCDVIRFEPKTHTYFVNGERVDSTTQILARQQLTTDLSNAPKKLLKEKAIRGSYIHEEIDRFVKYGEMGISDEFYDFLRLVYPLSAEWWSEVMVVGNGYAGTADLVGYDKDGVLIIVDTKTGAVNTNGVTWQTSLYGYAITDKPFRCFVFDAKMGGESKVEELNPIPYPCINAMLDADRNGEIYSPVRDLATSKFKELADCEKAIADLNAQVESLTETRDKVYASLMKAMENGRVTSYESDRMRVTYTAPYKRTTVDSERLKSNYPSTYKDCLKTSNVKASIRVTIKETA